MIDEEFRGAESEERRAHAPTFTTAELLATLNKAGETPLHVAAREGLDDICCFLLSRGADPFIASAWGTHAMPIHLAALGGHQRLFEPLTRDNFDKQSRCRDFLNQGAGRDEWPALHWAVASHLDPNPSIEPLITVLASKLEVAPRDVVNHSTRNKITAIEIAARLGHVSVCTFLMINDAMVGRSSGRELVTVSSSSNACQVVLDRLQR